MKFFTLLATLFIGLQTFAQDQPGYYIDNGGKKTEGYFKTTDFYNENALEFTGSPGAGYTKLEPAKIKEYGISGQFKFEKHEVKIDMSPTNVRKLSGVKEPEWVTRIVFLNVLVEGDATLYSYKQNGDKYFYLIKSKDYPEELIYKKYKQSETAIAENKQYRQQLFNNLNCENKGIEEFTNIDYSEGEFVKLFKSYNTCKGSESIEYSNTTAKKIKRFFTVYAGAGNMSFGIKGGALESGKNSDLNYSAGAEFAFRMPSDKWEFFFRGEFEKMSSDITYKFNNTSSSVRTRYKLDASNVNLYMGPRYNFNINNTNKIFIDGAFGMNFPFGNIENSVFLLGDNPNSTSEIKLKTSFFANFGVGYVFNDKYGICVRYETNRNMFTNSPLGYTTQISRVMLNLRYTF